MRISSRLALAAALTAVLGSALLVAQDAAGANRARARARAATEPAAPVATIAQAGPRPHGIYALIGWDEVPSMATWQNPSVDGVVIRTYWRDLNPSPGVYKWDYLDAQFQAAAKADKKVRLMIAPGFYAPDYVLQNPRVQKADFDVPQGPLQGKHSPLPLPWDDTYLNAWFAFVDQVAARYRDNPLFTYISATGPNSHNGEVSLPREAADNKEWERLGDPTLLQSKVLGAWDKTIDHYCSVFKGKQFTVAIILRSFPFRLGGGSEREYQAALASYGANHCPSGFGLQSNGLDGRPVEVQGPPLRQWDLIAGYGGKIFTGFQTRAPANLYKCRRAEPNCAGTKQKIFQQVLANGFSRHVDVLEIYEGDLQDPNLASLMASAHQQLNTRSPNP